jgi:hypothetical protein
MKTRDNITSRLEALQTERDDNPYSEVFMKLMAVIRFEICYGLVKSSRQEAKSLASNAINHFTANFEQEGIHFVSQSF